jgi:hypothetical protein
VSVFGAARELMAERPVGTIEHLTERKAVTYQTADALFGRPHLT